MLSIKDELPYNYKELLDQAAEWLILLEEIREGVQDQLCHQLIPKLLELRWQSESTRSVIMSHAMLRV